MKDQASIGKESPEVKYDRALALFTESVLAPDHNLMMAKFMRENIPSRY